jgi:type IV secretory pathway TrbL component
MSKLDKDQVVADFTTAYKAAFGKEPQLEQKPGWFSVDGGKNIRLAELAELAASYGSAKAKPAAAKPATEKKAAAPKAAAKPAAKPAKAAKAKATGNGQSAAAVWTERLDSKQRQPRGCR